MKQRARTALCSAYGRAVRDLYYSLFAQTFYGTLAGTVSDSSGAPMEGAAVTATNTGTGTRQAVQTSNAGEFRIVNLVPGNYKLDVEKTGFKRATRDAIPVQVESVVRIDIAMQVGEMTQSIEVEASAPLLQTENASLSQVVSARSVEELPLNGRNVLNLVNLVPGVVPQGGSDGSLTGKNVFSAGNYQIGGGTANQSATFFDGVPVNITYGNVSALTPSAGRCGRVPRSDQQQHGGVRPLYGRRYQYRFQGRHERISRHRCTNSCATRN